MELDFKSPSLWHWETFLEHTILCSLVAALATATYFTVTMSKKSNFTNITPIPANVSRGKKFGEWLFSSGAPG
jgi:hypothetical protein